MMFRAWADSGSSAWLEAAEPHVYMQEQATSSIHILIYYNQHDVLPTILSSKLLLRFDLVYETGYSVV